MGIGKVIYWIGVFGTIVLFFGNLLVVELDLGLSMPLYIILSFGYVLSFVTALVGALLMDSSAKSISHAWKIALIAIIVLVGVRELPLLFKSAGTFVAAPWYFGAMAFVIVSLILLIVFVMAQKLPGKTGAALLGTKIQIASFLFFIIAATMTCSLGAIAADPEGITLTNKTRALHHQTLLQYGINVSYQVITSWVVGLILFIYGNLLEIKDLRR